MNSTFYREKLRLRPVAKYAVALRAVRMLEEGDSILIDAGTSLTPIAQIIKALGSDYSKRTHFTIMTHNQAAFDNLIGVNPEAQLNVFQTGGRYDKDLNASFGHQAESAYENYHPKWVFIGQSGLDADRGLFCHGNTEELSLKKIIFSKPALRRVVISDIEKLGIPGGLCFGTSDKLTDNVEHCILLTNEPDDELQKYETPDMTTEDREKHRRYERQISILSDTYQVIIIPVKYRVDPDGPERKTIHLTEVPPPRESPRWMGIEKDEINNVTIVRKGDDEWIVDSVEISAYSEENREGSLPHSPKR